MPNPFKKIIKNTEESEQTYYNKGIKTSSEIKTRVCPKCNAPRPTNTNLTTCDYCGFKFMDIAIEVKADK